MKSEQPEQSLNYLNYPLPLGGFAHSEEEWNKTGAWQEKFLELFLLPVMIGSVGGGMGFLVLKLAGGAAVMAAVGLNPVGATLLAVAVGALFMLGGYFLFKRMLNQRAKRSQQSAEEQKSQEEKEGEEGLDHPGNTPEPAYERGADPVSTVHDEPQTPGEEEPSPSIAIKTYKVDSSKRVFAVLPVDQEGHVRHYYRSTSSSMQRGSHYDMSYTQGIWLSFEGFGRLNPVTGARRVDKKFNERDNLVINEDLDANPITSEEYCQLFDEVVMKEWACTSEELNGLYEWIKKRNILTKETVLSEMTNLDTEDNRNIAVRSFVQMVYLKSMKDRHDSVMSVFLTGLNTPSDIDRIYPREVPLFDHLRNEADAWKQRMYGDTPVVFETSQPPMIDQPTTQGLSSNVNMAALQEAQVVNELVCERPNALHAAQRPR